MRLKSLYPAGACSGATKEGKRCGIRDVFQNGFCRHHGGQGKLLREIYAEAKLEGKIQRAERRAKRTQALIDRVLQDNPALRLALQRSRDGRKPAQG